MNAAARLFNQGVLSRGWAITFMIERLQVTTLLLLIALLTSALSMVYVTNLARSTHAALQQTLLERDHMHSQWNQLLLEKSTWMMQARVQKIAEDKLGMIYPESKSVVIVD